MDDALYEDIIDTHHFIILDKEFHGVKSKTVNIGVIDTSFNNFKHLVRASKNEANENNKSRYRCLK